MTTQTKPGCGSRTTMGHGESAICGEPYYSSIYVCADCQSKRLKAAIALLTSIVADADDWTKECKGMGAEAQESPILTRIRAFLKGGAA